MEHAVPLASASAKPRVQGYFDTPRYWRERANQARVWAERLPPVRRDGMLQISDEYDQLAEIALTESLFSLSRYPAV
jgi:hypothetical protein